MAEILKMESFYETENVLELNTTSLHTLTRDKRQTIMVLFYVTCKKLLLLVFIFLTAFC